VLLEKRQLTTEDLEAQVALELPERDMMALITVIITDVLNNNTVSIDVNNNKVAVQVCALVNLLNDLTGTTTFSCRITQ
jgi:hypothetical protein